MKAPDSLYLDYQSTTPVDPRVATAMAPYASELFGNPHSKNHAHGWQAEDAVTIAREQVAALIGAEPREIIFTSGATESNNLALKGLAHAYAKKGRHIITAATEHSCVLASCRALERDGFEVTTLPVDSVGRIDLTALEAAIHEDTLTISLMAVNNEIGVIHPLAEIGAIARKHNVFFHTDAAQAVGKIPLDVEAMNIDLLSLSGHKLYGPKGIGALYVRRRNPRVKLTPLIDGGGQEGGLRSGTLPTPLCVGLGKACEIAGEEMAEERTRLADLHQQLWQQLSTSCPDLILNGPPDLNERWPGNLNIQIPGVDGPSLTASLKALAISSGAACSSESPEPSHVLKALGLSDEAARASLRIGLGRPTTAADIDTAAQILIEKIQDVQAKQISGGSKTGT